jgi:hypothetical protein
MSSEVNKICLRYLERYLSILKKKDIEVTPQMMSHIKRQINRNVSRIINQERRIILNLIINTSLGAALGGLLTRSINKGRANLVMRIRVLKTLKEALQCEGILAMPSIAGLRLTSAELRIFNIIRQRKHDLFMFIMREQTRLMRFALNREIKIQPTKSVLSQKNALTDFCLNLYRVSYNNKKNESSENIYKRHNYEAKRMSFTEKLQRERFEQNKRMFDFGNAK